MKLMLIGMTQYRYMPYMDFYMSNLDIDKNEVHIVTWNRDDSDDIDVPEKITRHTFSCYMMDTWSMKKKMPKFILFRKFVQNCIRHIAPDFLVVHYSTTAILLYDLLSKKYKNLYFFDFRDITYEKNVFFKKMVAKVTNNSRCTFTSSDGFRQYLPKTEKLITIHNIDLHLSEKTVTVEQRELNDNTIRIACWGLLRGFKANCKMAEKLGGDKRFELHYYGRAQGRMKAFLDENTKKYDNIFYHGSYSPIERQDFVKVTDIINNLYDDNDKTMTYAMSNKYYDGIVFQLPQICNINSYMGERVLMKGIGISINLDDEDFGEKIVAYYKKYDRKSFLNNCQQSLREIKSDMEKCNLEVRSIFDNKSK